MNNENNSNYYAIIPAFVRYNKDLKSTEKLLYGEITALSNKNGYCYANNRYFAELYGVTNETISRWLSHLQKLKFVKMQVIRDSKQAVISRHIYIFDVPYCQKNQYPYCQTDQYPIDKNVKENNTSINIDDDIFNLIINNSIEIPKEFYSIIQKLEFNYTQDSLKFMQPNKIQMLKVIVYTLYELYNSNFDFLLSRVSRESLLNLYMLSEEHNPENFLNYYKRAIINEYSDTS